MTKTSLIYASLLVAAGAVAACFNTKNIQSGGLKCAPSADPAVSPGVCPDGFFCGEGHLCYRNGSGAEKLCLVSEAQKPFGPFPSCSPPQQSTSFCDPVCQSGCSCHHRCQMVPGESEFDYSFQCVAQPAGQPLGDFQVCDLNNDLCAPGWICLAPLSTSTGCQPQCFRHCRQDSDCPQGSRCLLSIDVGDGKEENRVCSPPAVACNPVITTSAPGCANSLTGNTCYVFSVDAPDETMCDCEGTFKLGEACNSLHSCVAGHECVQGKCEKMCLLATGGVVCPTGQKCVPLANSTRFGTCQ